MADERATAIIERMGTAARRTYKTVIYETLHELIQDLTLPPGERLVEADLAARFDVSKTPIREALLMLEQDNLVTIVPHVGATVTALSIADYEQQLFLQDALEQPALPRVVERITLAELTALEALIERITRAHARRDARLYHQLVRRMHTELFTAARYPRLMDHIDMVMQALRRYHPIFVRPFDENWRRELAIITGRFRHVRAGDPAAATALVQRGHVEMLDFARRRVEARDPAVWRYVSTQGEGGVDPGLALHGGA
jgi:DNA-binding GntR family transcriptional regulator